MCRWRRACRLGTLKAGIRQGRNLARADLSPEVRIAAFQTYRALYGGTHARGFIHGFYRAMVRQAT